MLLCPLGLPGRTSNAVTIAAGRPAFALLVAALARPDEPPTGGACAEYADLPQIVLAKTGNAVYQVSIPTDACGHYQHPALDALNRARRGGTSPR